MKIVIINECKISGGCEVYVQVLRNLLKEHGHDVNCIYLHCDDNPLDDDEYVLDVGSSWIYKFISNSSGIKQFKSLLLQLNPECVIINNVSSSPLTVYKALFGYKCIQIVHDYSIVCPKSTCITNDGEVCIGYGMGKCYKLCTHHKSRILLLLKCLLLRQVEKNRRNAVKQYISPSIRLANHVKANGDECIAIPNPISSKVVDNKQSKNRKKYVYLGRIDRNKGVYDLLPAFSEFARDKDVCLEIYGKTNNHFDEDFLKMYLSDKIIFRGFIAHEKIVDVLVDAYALLVPSYWMENYPTTVLEGFANRVLVIGSDRGGIPELLSDGRGICYKYGKNGLLKALERSQRLTFEEYNMFTNLGVDYVKENNSMEKYYERIMGIMSLMK